MSEMTTELGADALVGHSPFPPIADYGFLSDCETTALVAPSGATERMCLPRADSAPIFGEDLHPDAAACRLGTADTDVPASRRYLPGPMIDETFGGARLGGLSVRDLLLVG